MFSEQCLLLGLHGYLIRFATLAFIPHCQIRANKMPSLVVSLIEINVFYHYLDHTSCSFRSQVQQYSLHALTLRVKISQGTY